MVEKYSRPLRMASVALAGAALTVVCATGHAQDKPIRIGLVTFLSGPAAGPFGVPAKVAAEAIVDSLNAGKAPAPYNTKGFGGTPLELAIVDEAGGATKQVTELRNLVERQNVDFVDRKSTRLNSSHLSQSRMPSSA